MIFSKTTLLCFEMIALIKIYHQGMILSPIDSLLEVMSFRGKEQYLIEFDWV